MSKTFDLGWQLSWRISSLLFITCHNSVKEMKLDAGRMFFLLNKFSQKGGYTFTKKNLPFTLSLFKRKIPSNFWIRSSLNHYQNNNICFFNFFFRYVCKMYFRDRNYDIKKRSLWHRSEALIGLQIEFVRFFWHSFFYRCHNSEPYIFGSEWE